MHSIISTEGWRVGTAITSGMPHSASAAKRESFSPSGRSAGSSVTMAKSRAPGSHRSRAACGGGPMRGIVRRWPGSNASWVIDLTSLFERVFDGVDAGLCAGFGACPSSSGRTCWTNGHHRSLEHHHQPSPLRRRADESRFVKGSGAGCFGWSPGGRRAVGDRT